MANESPALIPELIAIRHKFLQSGFSHESQALITTSLLTLASHLENFSFFRSLNTTSPYYKFSPYDITLVKRNKLKNQASDFRRLHHGVSQSV